MNLFSKLFVKIGKIYRKLKYITLKKYIDKNYLK